MEDMQLNQKLREDFKKGRTWKKKKAKKEKKENAEKNESLAKLKMELNKPQTNLKIAGESIKKGNEKL